MSGLRYAQVSQKEPKFLDLTSLTVQEFDQLVPAFEEAFEQRMRRVVFGWQETLRTSLQDLCQLSAAHPRGSPPLHLGLRENECVASRAGRAVRHATK